MFALCAFFILANISDNESLNAIYNSPYQLDLTTPGSAPDIDNSLNLILDKQFLISKMNDLENDTNYPFYYVFNFKYENNLIKIFFDKKSLDLVGWETRDIYQNFIQTFISDIVKNNFVDESLFNIQKYIN